MAKRLFFTARYVPSATGTKTYEVLRGLARKRGLGVWVSSKLTDFAFRMVEREIRKKNGSKLVAQGIEVHPGVLAHMELVMKKNPESVRNGLRLIVARENAHSSSDEKSLEKRIHDSSHFAWKNIFLEARANRIMISELLERCGLGSVTEVTKKDKASEKFLDHLSDFFVLVYNSHWPGFRNTAFRRRYLPFTPREVEDAAKALAKIKLGISES